MSQQSTLDKFFAKTVSIKNPCPQKNMSPVIPKKRNLSITRITISPTKCIKSDKGSVSVKAEIVDLCDDDSDDDTSNSLNARVKQENISTNFIKIENSLEPKNGIKLEFPTPSKSKIKVKTSDRTLKHPSTPDIIQTNSSTSTVETITPRKDNVDLNLVKATPRKDFFLLKSPVLHSPDTPVASTARSSVLPKTSQTTESNTKQKGLVSVKQEIVDLCDYDSDENASVGLDVPTNSIKIENNSEPHNGATLGNSTPSKSLDKLNTSEQTIEYSLTPELEKSFEHDMNSDDSLTADVTGLAEASLVEDSNYVKSTSRKNSPDNQYASTSRSSVSPQTPKSNSSPAIVCVGSSSRNPGQLSYYSPNKKRKIMQRNGNARRNLNTELSDAQNCKERNNLDETFIEACTNMDDKTIFMLNVIYRYLKDESLHNLLDPTSHSLLCNCLHMTQPGMRIVCRFYWKKEGWYKYEEMEKVALQPVSDDVKKCLVDAGLIVEGDNTSMTFDDYTNILKREDLLQICKELNMKLTSKLEAVQELLKFSKRTTNISNYFTKGPGTNNLSRLLKIMSEKTGLCYKLSDAARSIFYRLYVLMYLGISYDMIREKRLEYMHICEKIGKETFPINKEMELDSASIIFSSRDEFERYITAHTIYEDYLQRTDLEEKCSIIEQCFNIYKSFEEEQMSRYSLLPCWLHRYTPVYIYIKLLEHGIKELKKKQEESSTALVCSILDALIAQDNFRQHKKAEWYAEKALVLDTSRCYMEAANTLLQGFNSELSEEAKDTLRPRALRLANRCAGRGNNPVIDEQIKKQLIKHATTDRILEATIGGEHIHKPPMERVKNRGKLKFETKSANGKIVQDAEQYCIEYYLCNHNFTNGEHWEGRIMTTIFYLLFWDIIYSKPAGVQGVFLSHYQQNPLDLYTDSFYRNRKTDIDNRLNFIDNATMPKLLKNMEDIWNMRPESELSGINRSIGWNNVSMVCSCLAPRRVSAICRRLALDYQYTHSGFPDLTLWNRYTNQIKFVEVKTDSDKPSMKQIQWMNFLKEIQIDTEFCYVGVNTKRQRCRQDHKKTPKKGGRPKNNSGQTSKVEGLLKCDKCKFVCESRDDLINHLRVCKAQSTETSETDSSVSTKIKTENDTEIDFQIP